MQARYNEIIAAKTYFFNLKDIYPKVSTQIIAFTKADKAEKAKLLPTIRQQVETWLTNFSLLLETDQKILAAKNTQILKIAKKLNITAAKKIQTIPPAYTTARDAFLAAYNGLNHRNIVALNATAAEIETVNDLISQQNPNNPGIMGTIRNIKNDPTILQTDKDDMEADAREVSFLTYFSKLRDYRNLLNNNPFAAIPDNGASQAAYVNLSNAVADSEPILTQALATAEANLRADPNNNTFQAQVNELREKLTVLKDYKANLLRCAATTTIMVTDDNQSAAADGDGFIRHTVLPNGTPALEIMVNAATLNNLPANLTVADRQNIRNRIIAHEMQHAIQFNQGRVAYMMGTDNMSRLFYDINDEVEAFKVEFVYGVDPRVPGINIGNITPAYLRGLSNEYAVLSANALSINSTIAQLNAEGGDVQAALLNLIQQFSLGGAGILHNRGEAVNVMLRHPDGSDDANLCDNISFLAFLKMIRDWYPNSFGRLTGNGNPNPIYVKF